MNGKCPHCGTQYEFEAGDLCRAVTCQVCGKEFVLREDTGSGFTLEQPTAPSMERGRLSARKPQAASGRPSRVQLPDRLVKPNGSDTKPESSTWGGVRKIVTILVAVFGMLAVVGAAAVVGYQYLGDAPRLKRGCVHYEKGDYPKAYALLLPLAQKGDAEAQVVIGDCYANGQGVFMDTEEAVRWYRRAADQGLPKAQYRMFLCYRNGVGTDRNLENAAKWCRKAADAGLEEAMYDMGMLYVDGDGVEANAKSAFRWFRKGAERGHPPALYRFGRCYLVGYGVGKDEDEAAKWQGKAVDAWRAMANAGDTESMNRIGKLYEEGDVVDLDKEEAVNWYRKAAELGNPVAQLNLAMFYFSGDVVEKDDEEGAKWVLKSAEQGTHAASQWLMGCLYRDGRGVAQDSAEAFKWFARAAKRGSAAAKYELALCYLQGKGVEADAAKGESLLVDASAMGNKEAEAELKRIRAERAAEERRIEMEKRAEERRLAEERADKERKIEQLSEIEDDIEEFKNRINRILKGQYAPASRNGQARDDSWREFDAGKITMTDPSVSVVAEESPKAVADGLSSEMEMSAIERALSAAKKESERLEKRLADLVRVKALYDQKELESRKEMCAACKGSGSVVCARCSGKGQVVQTDSQDCGFCDGAGTVSRSVACTACGGKGSVQSKCSYCWKQGGWHDKKCFHCGGSGYSGRDSCGKCRGLGSLTVDQMCLNCRGSGKVKVGENVECPICRGKTKVACDRCKGKGYTYRPKQ